MLPIIHLGPLAVQTPGLVILAGIWIGLALAEHEAVRLRLEPDGVYGIVATSIVAAFVGARFVYVLRFWAAFQGDPLSMFLPSLASLDPAGGMAAVGIAVLIRVGKKPTQVRVLADTIAPFLAALAIAVGLAHLASGDAFGAPTRLPWSMYLWGEYRHPSQIYEIVAGLLALASWQWHNSRHGPPGTQFTFVVVVLCISAIFLEGFRGDSQIMAGGIRTAQIVATALLGITLVLRRYWSDNTKMIENQPG